MKILLVHTPFDWKRPITTLPHLIRKVAGVYNNHAALLIDGKIYESDINGVVEVHPKDWVKNQTVTVYEFPEDVNTKQYEIEAKALVKQHKYDFLSLFVWQPIYLATGWYIGPIGRKGKKRFYCFEYLAYVLDYTNYYKITPREFNDFCDMYFVKTHANVKVRDYLTIDL
jgi:hypothetical protein